MRRVALGGADGGGAVSTIAGLGAAGLFDHLKGKQALFNAPEAVAALADGALLVADGGSHAVRRVAPDGATRTLAGGKMDKVNGIAVSGMVDGVGEQARFVLPSSLAVAPLGGGKDKEGGDSPIELLCFVAEKSGRIVRARPPPSPHLTTSLVPFSLLPAPTVHGSLRTLARLF